MSYPTLLAPWYVVQQLLRRREFDYLTRGEVEHIICMQYYRSADTDDSETLTNNPHDAMIFSSLPSAARVARATGGEVRVLTSKDELAEFRPKGEL